MQRQKLFSLDEARQLIPVLRELLQQANAELSELGENVSALAVEYQSAEEDLDNSKDPVDNEKLRARRKRFETVIEKLSNAQQQYLKRFNHWVDKITLQGVILRDLREGLLDFPAEENGFAYLLCWRMDEKDIDFWHLESDGFIGRKPLAALMEYC